MRYKIDYITDYDYNRFSIFKYKGWGQWERITGFPTAEQARNRLKEIIEESKGFPEYYNG